MINYQAHGMDVRVWGSVEVQDELGSHLEYTQDKGTIRAIPTSISPNEASDGNGRIDQTSLILIALADAIIDTGDQVEFDGVRYQCLASLPSWRQYHRGVVDHLEIPLRAA